MSGALTPRVLLVSVRDADDPMIEHEHACFARIAQLPREAFVLHPIETGPVAASDLDRVDAVVIGGSGAYSVLSAPAWFADLTRLIHMLCDRGMTTWATCFGFQALALALGGEVVHDEARMEMGSVALRPTEAGRSDALVGELPDPFWVQQGHHDHVVSLPNGLIPLARGAVDCEQLVRVDGAPIYASQFHPELCRDDLVHRFRYYSEHYAQSDPGGFARRLREMASAPDSPEVCAMLARLVRSA